MTHRIGAKGQVVIPKELRDELGLEPGAEVDFERDGSSVRIVPAGVAAALELGGRYRGERMTDSLLADRARERR